MGRRVKLSAGWYAAGVLLLAAAFVAIVATVLRHTHLALLTPAGPIGQQEKHLMLFALALSLFVIVPVFVMLFAFAWRYRAGNVKAKYSPELDRSRVAETLWWGIPGVLILILSVVTWTSSHSLDPFRPLSSAAKPLTIQVVALDWKWLFIYPDQRIATVNYVQLPVNTPVTFDITADAPMNSFWIPKLGGQIYAMPGMSTQLHLEATQVGSYPGSSANISGVGFSGMRFTAKATSAADFNAWVARTQKTTNTLTEATYATLAHPSQNNPVVYYSLPDTNLYNTVMMQYMAPATSGNATEMEMH
ncbi:MAG TPA: ubiquinol oxidase subunit II [Candidatus Saccharimonadales bacterium]|nr:ubiquinol oxidase subunit II [Candidatus Saccharimonadales bacterium]